MFLPFLCLVVAFQNFGCRHIADKIRNYAGEFGVFVRQLEDVFNLGDIHGLVPHHPCDGSVRRSSFALQSNLAGLVHVIEGQGRLLSYGL